MILQLRHLIAAAALPAAWSCGSDAGAEGEADRTAVADVRTAATVVTTAPEPDACELIPIAEIERIVGPIDGQPKRDGKGCWYYFPTDSSKPGWVQNREWERRMRASGADSRAIALYGNRRTGLFVDVDVTGARVGVASGSESTGKAERVTGWDQVSLGRGRISGRVGHVTVKINLQELKLPEDTLAAMAATVRDRIPDRPFAHPAADRSGAAPPGRDPCSVLSRAEAEAVLGKLAVPPFRTRESTPLADPAGKSCAYFTPGHRVLVLTPEWEYGKMALNTERMVGGLVGQVADLPGAAADTLEGPWDDVAISMSGDLIVLKGPRALTIGYLMSSTDAAGAIKLAGPALGRLAAAPEPARPSVVADGCLQPAVVSEIIEMPVRLAAKYMNREGVGGCSYQLEADPTVSVELTIKPAAAADSVFREIQSAAKVVTGSAADRIEVGQGGWAFGGKSQSRAAVLAGGKVYEARIRDPLGSSASGRKDAMMRLIARMSE